MYGPWRSKLRHRYRVNSPTLMQVSVLPVSILLKPFDSLRPLQSLSLHVGGAFDLSFPGSEVFVKWGDYKFFKSYKVSFKFLSWGGNLVKNFDLGMGF